LDPDFAAFEMADRGKAMPQRLIEHFW